VDFGLVSKKKISQKYGSLGWRPGPGKFAKNAKTCPQCDVTFRKPQIQNEKNLFNLQLKTCWIYRGFEQLSTSISLRIMALQTFQNMQKSGAPELKG